MDCGSILITNAAIMNIILELRLRIPAAGRNGRRRFGYSCEKFQLIIQKNRAMNDDVEARPKGYALCHASFEGVRPNRQRKNQ